MADSLRREVLKVFKKLHRTRLNTFKDDEDTLAVVRNKINEEYRKHKNITDPATIQELHKLAQDVEHEVRTRLVQAVEKKPGHFVLRITPDTIMYDNAEFPSPTEMAKQFNHTCCKESTVQKDEK